MFILMGDSMKVIGLKTKDQVEVLKYSCLAILIKVNLTMESLMEKDYINGLMEKFMMENGNMESKKAMEFGKGLIKTHILVNGKTTRQMVTGFINGKMVR